MHSSCSHLSATPADLLETCIWTSAFHFAFQSLWRKVFLCRLFQTRTRTRDSSVISTTWRHQTLSSKYTTVSTLLAFWALFLPPAYVVRGKVIFILGNVCLFTIGWGGGTPSQVWVCTPSQVGGYPISGLGGYPIPGLDGGVPHPRSGQGVRVPHPRSGWGVGVPHSRTGWGVPHPRSGWEGYPIPGLDGGGYPIPGLDGRGTPSQVWMGGTWGTPPHHDWMGYPHQDWMGYPPPPWLGYPPHHDWMGHPPPA